MRHQNYWNETCPTKQLIMPGIVKSVDTLIIGGGIAGTILLFQLVNAGLGNTYLVEESTVGFHASGRSSGQLLLVGRQLFSEMKLGKEYLNVVCENNRRFLSGLRNARFDIDLRESGGVHLTSNTEDFEKLREEAKFISENANLDCPVLDTYDTLSLVNSNKFYGGIFVPNEALFNPYKLVNGLREFLEQKGLRVLTNSRVSGVTQNDDGTFSVEISHKGIIKAKRIVYCTGPYITELVPELSDYVSVFRSQMIATDIIKDSTLKNLPTMSVSFNDAYSRTYGGRLLVGGLRKSVRGGQEGIMYDGEISAAVNEKLKSFVGDIFPFMKSVKFVYSWSNIGMETKDGLPIVGEIKPNQYVMTGIDYHNMISGSLILKDLLMSGVTEKNLFDPKRFTI